MSARRSTLSGVVICSGAIDSGVPITMPRRVPSSSAARKREMPKSKTFT